MLQTSNTANAQEVDSSSEGEQPRKPDTVRLLDQLHDAAHVDIDNISKFLDSFFLCDTQKKQTVLG